MYPTICQVLGFARFHRLFSDRVQGIHRRGEIAFVQSPASLRHRLSRVSRRPGIAAASLSGPLPGPSLSEPADPERSYCAI